MPRTLPWLPKGESSKGRVKSESKSRNSRDASPDDDDDKGKKHLQRTPSPSPSREEERDFFRSSQTPPSSPVRECPTEEFLIEGLNNDDIYIMVEDEFYAIAQTFTKHLHQAEYIRRKKEARARNATAINDISRPTDGKTPMSAETRRKKEAEANADRQRAGVDRVTGVKRGREESSDNKEHGGGEDAEDDDDPEDLWAGTSLGGLMMSPRKGRNLVGNAGVKSSTKAAAGYSQPGGFGKARSGGDDGKVSARGGSNNDNRDVAERSLGVNDETASEDDDLDISATVRKGSASKPPSTQQPPRRPPPEQDAPAAQTAGQPTKQPDRETSSVDSKRPKHRTSLFFRSKIGTPIDKFDDLPMQKNADISLRSDKRNTSSTKEEPGSDSPRSKRSRLNEVPTFLV